MSNTEIQEAAERAAKRIESIHGSSMTAGIRDIIMEEFEPTKPEGVVDVLLPMEAWEKRYSTHIIDPDGWRGDGKKLGDLITKEEFARRWSQSTANQNTTDEFEVLLKSVDMMSRQLKIEPACHRCGGTGIISDFYDPSKMTDCKECDGRGFSKKLIPWASPADVPPVCFLRPIPGPQVRDVVHSITEYEPSGLNRIGWQTLFNNYEWSASPGGPWRKCGKIEV